MQISFEFWLTTDKGVRLLQLTSILSAEFSRELNKAGTFRILLPRSFDINYIRKDYMVQVWMQPTGGRLGLWRAYLLRRWQFSLIDGVVHIELGGLDMLDLLRRRVVAAYTGTAQTSKTTYADDMVKAVVTESLADGVAPTPTAGTRVWSNLSVAANFSLAPSVDISFPAFEKLLTSSGQGALALIAKSSKEAGTELYYDVIPYVVSSDSITFLLVTYVNYINDVSDSVSFELESGSLKEPVIEFDYMEEDNYIYGAGQGEDTNRVVHQVYNVASYSESIWGRSEGFADARNKTRVADVIAAARSALQDAKPRIKFSAQPLDTEMTRYGVHWDVGYKVTAKFLNLQFTPIVRAVVLTLNESGKTDIRARLNYEGAL